MGVSQSQRLTSPNGIAQAQEPRNGSALSAFQPSSKLQKSIHLHSVWCVSAAQNSSLAACLAPNSSVAKRAHYRNTRRYNTPIGSAAFFVLLGRVTLQFEPFHASYSPKATITASTNMINNSGLPGFQRFQLNNSPITVSRSNNTAVFPTQTSTICATPASNEGGDEELRRLRSNYVVLIERMLRNHQPHDVLNHVPENTDWRSKTFKLALKIERLMFKAAKSRADYMNEHTLSRRVKVLCRHLVRIRMRKNAMTEGLTNRC